MRGADDATREAYLSWLRDEVKRWCNEEGFFEAEWDRDDSIRPDQILDAYQSYEERGYASPLACLESKLLEDTRVEEIFYEHYLLTDLSEANEEVSEGWDSAQSVWEDLESVGYRGIDPNIEQLLSQSGLRVNVFFATEAEQNFDMGSIVDAFGNDYRSPDLDRISGEDLDNALSYLVNQQGHSVTEVYDSVYGLVSSMWCPNFSYREGVETGVKEDYDAVLELARKAPQPSVNEAVRVQSASAALPPAPGLQRTPQSRLGDRLAEEAR